MDLVHVFDNIAVSGKGDSIHHILLQGSFTLPVDSSSKNHFRISCNTLQNYVDHLVFVANLQDKETAFNETTSLRRDASDPLKKIQSSVLNPIIFKVKFCYNHLPSSDFLCETPSVEILRGKHNRGIHTVYLTWPLALPYGLDSSTLYTTLCGGVSDFIGYYVESSLAVCEHFGRLVEVEPHLFLTDTCLAMVAYPKEKKASHEDTESFLRSSIQQGLELSMDFPQVRRNQSLLYRDPDSNLQLVNPHLSVQNPHGPGIVSCVRGRYTYKHYQQDGIEDKNWGCAYRSLQTIVSWFRWQGYIDCEAVPTLPTHLDIQKMLVRLRDKPAKFVSSREWIGSFEVSLCVKEFCAGVEGCIVHVINGAAMADQARTLLTHFEVQGTPVMIGGGVLAHTILGVYWDEATGVVKFLVLDPHYIGSDDLKPVIDKGWCGWKSVDFWVATESYNMCLPQRLKGL